MYPNGEPIRETHIEDEVWYPDYQAMLELATSESEDVDELVTAFRLDYNEIFNKDYPDLERLKRWAESIYET